jgi:hypothetical protein
MPSPKKIFTLFFFFLLPGLLSAQTFSTEKLGLSIGLHLAFGTHFQRAGLVYNWFNVLKQNSHYIVGYTIMTNHVHAIIAFHNTEKTINSIMVMVKDLLHTIS